MEAIGAAQQLKVNGKKSQNNPHVCDEHAICSNPFYFFT